MLGVIGDFFISRILWPNQFNSSKVHCAHQLTVLCTVSMEMLNIIMEV